MKTIGLIGGMSWESTADYYRILNTAISRKLGGLHSAKLVLYSVDFYELEKCLQSEDWDTIAEILTNAAQSLERAGADFIVICTNTMHKAAPRIQSKVGIPILHIAEVTADALLAQGIRKAALLGTSFTMEQDFYTKILTEKGIDVMIPDKADREFINRTIFDELCLGMIKDTSKSEFLSIISKLQTNGAKGVILGCTEIGMLIQQKDTPIPLFDTTMLHAASAAMRSLE